MASIAPTDLSALGPGAERRRFDLGVAAFRRREYEVAARILLPIVGRGARYRGAASRYLAYMYARGVGGLPRNPTVARYWRGVAAAGRGGVLGGLRALATRLRLLD